MLLYPNIHELIDYKQSLTIVALLAEMETC